MAATHVRLSSSTSPKLRVRCAIMLITGRCVRENVVPEKSAATRAELRLYYHPLSSFCWKALVALYENDTPFEPYLVDLGNETARREFRDLWPIGKFPVLHDRRAGRTIPETSILVEYLAQHWPGKTPLLPKDPQAALEVRLRDRLYDLYVHMPMQKIVGDRLRAADQTDSVGVEEARGQLRTAYDLFDRQLASSTWAAGDAFTMADCAAAPALYYGNRVAPFEATHRNLAAYLKRLTQRPSFARVLQEAEPYFKYFPQERAAS